MTERAYDQEKGKKANELSEDELDRVAGGKPENPQRIWKDGYKCPKCQEVYKRPGKCPDCKLELKTNYPGT